MLLAAAVPAFAGDTRNVFVGSPGAADETLIFTPVSAGQATKTDVLIRNDSPSTMNKTTLSIGTFPAPALPAGVTVATIFGADAGACSIAANKLSATCDFGNLRSGQSKNVSIIFGITNGGATQIKLAVKVKETVNDNGANKDTFLPSANLDVAPASCDAVMTFAAPGQARKVTTDNGTGCTPQTTSSTSRACPRAPSSRCPRSPTPAVSRAASRASAPSRRRTSTTARTSSSCGRSPG